MDENAEKRNKIVEEKREARVTHRSRGREARDACNAPSAEKKKVTEGEHSKRDTLVNNLVR